MGPDGPTEEIDVASTPGAHRHRGDDVLRAALDVGQIDTAAHGAQRRRTPKTAERVANDIVGEIVRRRLHTGDHLPLESAMLDQYGVSRSSLREALRLLEVQGLIHLKPGPGGGPVAGTVEPAYLARTAALFFYLGAATYDDLMRTQCLVEPLCAQLAATHPDRATVMAPFLIEPIPTDERNFRQETARFHTAVYELADNFVLTLLTQAVTHIVTELVATAMDPVELRPTILHEHATLATVIASGRPDEAKHLMTEHFATQHAFFREHWPERLDQLIEWQ